MSKQLDPWINMTGGAVSGMIAVTASYPFDLLKTRLHFEVQKGNRPTMIDTTKLIFREGYNTALVAHIKLTTTNSGFMGFRSAGAVLGFYRGLDQLLPEAAFKVLLRFLVFKETENLYRRTVMGDLTGTARLPMGAQMCCGALAGFVETAMVVQPFERGKTLRADFHSPYQVWGKAFKTGGFAAGMKSVYTGFGACASRQAISFPVFYKLKAYTLNKTGAKDLNNFQRLGYGFFAGCCSTCVTMPLDVAKTIAQKQQTTSDGVITILKQVYTKSGVRAMGAHEWVIDSNHVGLYTGLFARIGRVGLDRGFGFLAYEWVTELILKASGKQKH